MLKIYLRILIELLKRLANRKTIFIRGGSDGIY